MFSLRPLLIFFSLLLLLTLGFVSWQRLNPLPKKASLRVESNVTAEVSLQDEHLGATPVFLEDLDAGEFELQIKHGEQLYQSRIKLLGGTETTVRYNFAPTDIFADGYVLWFEKTRGTASISVIADPSDATLKLDGASKDKTPLFLDDLTVGEHAVRIEKDGYEPKDLRVRIEKDHLLHISVKLALRPLVPEPPTLDLDSPLEKVTVYKLINPKVQEIVDSDSLLLGSLHWVKNGSLGEGFPELDYLLDSRGAIYDPEEGEVVDPKAFDESAAKKEELRVGYLNLGVGGLSEKAQTALAELAAKTLKTPPPIDKIRILPTGTGWLRVRADASLTAAELTKVDIGQEFPWLAEKPGWVKIKLPDGREGWVSSRFTEKFQAAP